MPTLNSANAILNNRQIENLMCYHFEAKCSLEETFEARTKAHSVQSSNALPTLPFVRALSDKIPDRARLDPH